MNFEGGSVNTLGNMNRKQASPNAAFAAANEAHATQKGDNAVAKPAEMKPRRVGASVAFFAAGGAGFTGIGGAGALAAATAAAGVAAAAAG